MDLAIIDININTGYNPIFYAKSSRRIARSIDRTYTQREAQCAFLHLTPAYCAQLHKVFLDPKDQ